ncbi:hypothetical protein OG799_22585 [Micromonospora sp. NBC_00898]|uniref:hypothetical protein n=1 Tax=Micromonospora sp. NBC_00898 TaxID=2975981 RepID=UPI003866AAFD|nr:hypothetical protein OG799_22585 [Micromonospora sp. NBC_00898]
MCPIRSIATPVPLASSTAHDHDVEARCGEDVNPHFVYRAQVLVPGPEPLREDFASQKEFDAALRDWWRRGVEIEDDPAATQGALFLDDRGCGFATLLVVSGPTRGSMWFDDRCVDGGLRPVLDDAGERVGFAHWYRRFLAQRYPVAGKTEDGERWSASG